jgi:hypothetical protein
VLANSPSNITDTTIRGFSTFQTNMLMIPHYVMFMLLNLALVFLSKKLKERVLVSSLASWWQLIFLIVIVAIPDATNNWIKWAILTLLLSYPYCHPLLVSLTSGVSGGIRNVTTSIETASARTREAFELEQSPVPFTTCQCKRVP